MNAIFADGPFEPDVGRCVPGPPPLDPLVVEVPGKPPWVYRVLSVGSWSDPDHPQAIYCAVIPSDSEHTEWWADRAPEP